ncbi:MAG: C4-dicarboxylate ABC transporter substrate-binding protein [Roseovarius sp.]|nr:C4-dicarboxylate ABC transporter substrate-binding protein [Roseovarius sp.]MBK46001.1 C4-dicarboxylate ABC transporter substrate-binding protein [Roseovarius sp.]|tara:strand:+ start:8285 stop:9418 length:1134 start_codon:yes stop_codon:yes gene_type:complete
MKLTKTLALMAASAVLAATPALAEKRVTITNWVSPNHATSRGHAAFAEMTEAEFPDAFDFKLFSGGALLGPKPTLSGLRDGVADVGLLALTYFRSEMPYAQFVADFALLGEDHYAMAGATSEFVMLHCQPCKDEFAQNGMVALSGISTAPYVLLTTEPIVDIEDMKGVKIRTGGSVWDRWSTRLGAQPVNVPSSEMYDTMSHGVVTAAVQPVGALKGHSLIEVAKHLTKLPLGTYHSGSIFAISPKFWASLSQEEREKFARNLPEAVAQTEVYYETDDLEVLEEAVGLGLTVHEPSPEFLQDLVDFRAADLEEIARISREERGIENPEALIETYRGLIEKWHGLVEPLHPIRENPQVYADLLQQEIYSKIDLAAYPN